MTLLLSIFRREGATLASVAFDLSDLTTCIETMHYPADTAVAVGVSCLQAPDVVATVGVTPSGTPFSPRTMVYVGSLAKQITAACAAILVSTDQLSLESPITTWLPELPAWAKAVRVRHLIHHIADLPSEASIWTDMQRAGAQHRTSPAVLAALGRAVDYQPQPGTCYAYSNWGYVCLATIVERLTSSPLASFAYEHLFAPLGMRQTCYWSGPALTPPGAVALPHSLNPAPHSLGDGGVWTTVYDLLRWNDAFNQNALKITEILHTPGQLNDGSFLDYAWGVRVFEEQGQRIQSHGGGWPGATAKLVRLPDQGMSIAVVALHDEIEKVVALTRCVQRHLVKT